jgi:hypothetical protein
MKTLICYLFVIIIILIIGCKQKQYTIREVGEHIYFVDGSDSVLIGMNSIKKDLFKDETSNLLFKNNNVDSNCKEINNSGICERGGRVDVCESHHHNYEEIFGIYVNKKMLDSLSYKKAPSTYYIDIIYIYP